jgi:hypothetical protein
VGRLPSSPAATINKVLPLRGCRTGSKHVGLSVRGHTFGDCSSASWVIRPGRSLMPRPGVRHYLVSVAPCQGEGLLGSYCLEAWCAGRSWELPFVMARWVAGRRRRILGRSGRAWLARWDHWSTEAQRVDHGQPKDDNRGGAASVDPRGSSTAAQISSSRADHFDPTQRHSRAEAGRDPRGSPEATCGGPPAHFPHDPHNLIRLGGPALTPPSHQSIVMSLARMMSGEARAAGP